MKFDKEAVIYECLPDDAENYYIDIAVSEGGYLVVPISITGHGIQEVMCRTMRAMV